MAITATHYRLLKELPVARGSSLLEVGEANWYGDIDPQAVGLPRCNAKLFDIAKAFYADWFSPSDSVAIDMNGSENALRLDLNQPIDLGRTLGVVINHGTAEHIFNVAEVFRTAHNHCAANGWIIHDAPFLGWVDHGFYCLQPTLFYDLADANCYEVARVAIHETRSGFCQYVPTREHVPDVASSAPHNSMLFVVFRKRADQPFAIPAQGYYSRTISERAAKEWSKR